MKIIIDIPEEVLTDINESTYPNDRLVGEAIYAIKNGTSITNNDLISRTALSDHIKNRLIQTAMNNEEYITSYGNVCMDIVDNRIDTWINEFPNIQPNDNATKLEESINIFTRIEERFKKEVYHVGSKKFQIRADRYESNNNLALQVYCDGEPWARLSVNLDDKLPPHKFYVDVNNWPEAIDFIKQFEIAKPLYKEAQSGFCKYPLYELDRRFTKC